MRKLSLSTLDTSRRRVQPYPQHARSFTAVLLGFNAPHRGVTSRSTMARLGQVMIRLNLDSKESRRSARDLECRRARIISPPESKLFQTYMSSPRFRLEQRSLSRFVISPKEHGILRSKLLTVNALTRNLRVPKDFP